MKFSKSPQHLVPACFCRLEAKATKSDLDSDDKSPMPANLSRVRAPAHHSSMAAGTHFIILSFISYSIVTSIGRSRHWYLYQPKNEVSMFFLALCDEIFKTVSKPRKSF